MSEEMELPDEVEDEVEVEDTTEEPSETAEADEIEETQEVEAAPVKQLSRGQRDIIAARGRAQEAEEQLRKVRADLDEARRTPARQSQPSEDQRIFEQEEAVLRNPEATDWQRYAVQSNRSARQAESNSRTALHRAEDLADQAKFDKFAATKPKLYEAYKDKVDAELTRLRSTGVTAPREELLALLIGRDMRDGKIKASETKTTKPSGVNRGSTTGVKSDVSTSDRSRMSEDQKRARRLENIRI